MMHHSPELTDEALRLLRVLILARRATQYVRGVEPYYARLHRVAHRAWRRWRRRDAQAAGTQRPQVNGPELLTLATKRAVSEQVGRRIRQFQSEVTTS